MIPYSFDLIKTYIDDFDNKILVYRITEVSSGISLVLEGIHEHKIRRKGIKKIQKHVKELQRTQKTTISYRN